MTDFTVSTTRDNETDPIEVNFEYPVPPDHASMVSELGEATYYTLAQRQLSADVKNAARRLIKEGHDEETIIERIKGWTPAAGLPTISPKEALKNQMAGMSPEEKAKYIQELLAEG